MRGDSRRRRESPRSYHSYRQHRINNLVDKLVEAYGKIPEEHRGLTVPEIIVESEKSHRPNDYWVVAAQVNKLVEMHSYYAFMDFDVNKPLEEVVKMYSSMSIDLSATR